MHDVGALGMAVVVQDERAAFAACDVLAVMKADKAEVAEASELLPVMARADRLRGVLD